MVVSRCLFMTVISRRFLESISDGYLQSFFKNDSEFNNPVVNYAF